ncbi:uncharacterized protein LOC126816397 isoform X1 [Patella vulgata]|uniref:uncharacterized protein LOC126816397 isoform X1 n=2 Tax=Patella vulgata TaxID=6465 RepID=UPI00217F84FB|nr:uncharacterized protein LOC126816397 isoform X1 [Patella vulgata]
MEEDDTIIILASGTSSEDDACIETFIRRRRKLRRKIRHGDGGKNEHKFDAKDKSKYVFPRKSKQIETYKSEGMCWSDFKTRKVEKKENSENSLWSLHNDNANTGSGTDTADPNNNSNIGSNTDTADPNIGSDTDTAVGTEEEIWKNDIELAMVLSLQPHYLPKTIDEEPSRNGIVTSLQNSVQNTSINCNLHVDCDTKIKMTSETSKNSGKCIISTNKRKPFKPKSTSPKQFRNSCDKSMRPESSSFKVKDYMIKKNPAFKSFETKYKAKKISSPQKFHPYRNKIHIKNENLDPVKKKHLSNISQGKNYSNLFSAHKSKISSEPTLKNEIRSLKSSGLSRRKLLTKLNCSGKSWSHIKFEKANTSKCLENKMTALTCTELRKDSFSEEEFSDDLPDLDGVNIDHLKMLKASSNKGLEKVKESHASSDSPMKKIKLSTNKGLSVKECTSGLLFTPEHKNKLAKLLSTVSFKEKISKENCPTDGSSPTRSQNSDSRHFMDILDCLNSKGKLPNESDQSDASVSLASVPPYLDGNISSPDYFVQYTRESCYKKDLRYQHLSNKTYESSFESLRSNGVNTDDIEKNTSKWVESHLDIVNRDMVTENFPFDESVEIGAKTMTFLRKVSVKTPSSKPCDNIIPQTSRRSQHVGSFCKITFPPSSIDNNIIDSFSAMHLNNLDAAMEEGDTFFDYSLNMLKSFVRQKKPTISVVEDILLEKGLLGNHGDEICVKSYNLLRFVWQTYPDLINIKWDLLSDVIAGVTYRKNSSSYTNLHGGLLLHLYVFGLEVNLYKNSLKNRDKLLKTLVFKLLSVDAAFRNLKEIVKWIEFCINSTEIRGDGFLQMNIFPLPNNELGEKQLLQFDSPYKLLPDLNRLLNLGVEISRSCVEAAKRVAGELEKIYIYLSDIKRKKMLLHFISSDLLMLKLTQRVMEDYCDGTILSSTDFPVSFHRLKQSYFSAYPPRSPICTPPQSPSDDGDFNGLNQYSTECVEELSLLVFYVVKSYLACRKRVLYEPLHQRYNTEVFTEIDRSGLASLPLDAQQFFQHIQQLAPELSQATEQNCIMLTCLSETIQD